MNYPLRGLGQPSGLLGSWPFPLGLVPEKRKVFVSYHHDRDQYYYNTLSKVLENSFVPVQDNSLDRLIDSDDPEYVLQRIRDKHITGSSCTIVLCGSETGQRKYVDWETKATLDKEHGLIGIALPTCPISPYGKFIVPNRLHDNVESGYASFLQWNTLFPPQATLTLALMPLLKSTTSVLPTQLKTLIDSSVNSPKGLIMNWREKMKKNGVLT